MQFVCLQMASGANGKRQNRRQRHTYNRSHFANNAWSLEDEPPPLKRSFAQ